MHSLIHKRGFSALKAKCVQVLKEIENSGTFKKECVLTSKQGSSVSLTTHHKKLLNFCANNYLGLSSHPEVIEAGVEALQKYGAGLSSVRFICGTQDIHKALESKIARFHSRDDAILYAACFDANAGIFEVLLGPNDAVISDELNHASIIDGIRLCKAKKYRYKNRNMDDLEECLQQARKDGVGNILIVSDGAFSMDGLVTPLKEICLLKDKYQAAVFLDECHATGFLGATGRGTEEHYHMDPFHVDVINSTLGKALGGAAGGYTTGPQYVIDLLRQRSRPYLFSNSLPPPVVACASKAIDLIMDPSYNLSGKLQGNIMLFRSKMKDAGFTILGDDAHPICPVLLKDAKLASEFSRKMIDAGIFVIGFSYPVVPMEKARIRVQLSAVHTRVEIERAVETFIKVGRELNVI